MYIPKKTRSFAMVFLFITLIYLYPAKVFISYGQTSPILDKPSIIKTTDCINSMITGVFMGSNTADCTNNLNKKDSFKNNFSTIDGVASLHKKDPFFNFQNNNNSNSVIPTSSLDSMYSSLLNSGLSSSPNNPLTFPKSQKQNHDLSLVNTSSSLQLIHGKSKSGNSLDVNNELGNLLDKKNKHGKEIFACFNRAIVATNYLSDLAIIKCAKDHNSFK